ncbi:MAG: type VI secretion system lipoprotein TssJ [Gammaproteobacteria bacterium]|nr:type VI secretion system lipoprotein TssJ [Gammaproteobacteria bacterium]
MEIRKLYRWTLFMALLTVLAGCQSDKSLVGGYLNLDTDLRMEFIVEADINPDEQGVGSPLFLRMYQLKATSMIDKADFIDLYEQDKKALGADLVGEVYRLNRFKPGENRAEQFVLDQSTKFIALYGEFLDFKDSKFKLVIPVVTNNVFKNSAVIRISGNEIRLNDANN